MDLCLIGWRGVTRQRDSNSGVDTSSLFLRIRLLSGSALACVHTLAPLTTYHHKTARRSGDALQVHSNANLELKTYQRHIIGEEEVDVVTQCRESVICGMWQISSLSEMLVLFEPSCQVSRTHSLSHLDPSSLMFDRSKHSSICL